MKRINSIYKAPGGHWVGDGFPVRSLFTYDRMGPDNISPFLMLDYAGPAEFEPSNRPRGVGQHPHRGFETVTLVHRGELEHRDSSGGGGLIGEGDVQWMTAGAGIVHEEFHSPAFTKAGGTLEMVQLWVNLPARHKDAPAAYQTLLKEDIPVVPLDDSGSHLRIVAGGFKTEEGPARTFTPINVWDIGLKGGSDTILPLPEGHTTLLVMLDGSLRVNDADTVATAELATFERDGAAIRLAAERDTHALVLTGEPLGEPVAGYGPFVMNTQSEIAQTMTDFRNGTFGSLDR